MRQNTDMRLTKTVFLCIFESLNRHTRSFTTRQANDMQAKTLATHSRTRDQSQERFREFVTELSDVTGIHPAFFATGTAGCTKSPIEEKALQIYGHVKRIHNQNPTTDITIIADQHIATMRVFIQRCNAEALRIQQHQNQARPHSRAQGGMLH